MPLHPNYACHCQHPNPKIHLGEDTGICQACNLVYDENLYEMRLRQHTPNYTFDNLDEFMRSVDPNYAALTA